MANKQLTKDRLNEAILKSLVTFLRTDLATAWGGAVEVVVGHPDFDYERRPNASGALEPRDFSSTGPLAVAFILGGVSGPWAISPSGEEVMRTVRIRMNLGAANHFDITNWLATVLAVMDGSEDGTGGFPLINPANNTTVLGTIYFNDEEQLSHVFAGPGESDQGAVDMPEGKGQFGNLKHRASVVVRIDVRKPQGSAVI